jgi:hypothetical protein
MAQKRMFDRSIVDTDHFMDMPMSSKALYFLLGMDADDEGFVSARKVMKIHGGTEDDLNILLAKGYVIRFPSGVVVVTHWKKNNWLDTRRIRRTEYSKERSQLLTHNGNYVLSNGLASVEESRIEENSSSSNKIQERELTHAQQLKRLADAKRALREKKVL